MLNILVLISKTTQELSLTIEAEQLFYIEIQKLNYSLTSRFIMPTILEKYYTEKKLNELKDEVIRKIEMIDKLSNQVDACFKNISTPIKSKNDFKLQESTDKVNDRILFLSFIAMSVPLITSISSNEKSLLIRPPGQLHPEQSQL